MRVVIYNKDLNVIGYSENGKITFDDNYQARSEDSFLSTDEIKRKKAEIKQAELEAKKKSFNIAIQTHLDKKAQEFRFDNIMSARSYVGFENPFKDIATKLANWASICWIKGEEIEKAVEEGSRIMPKKIEEVISELPVFKEQ